MYLGIFDCTPASSGSLDDIYAAACKLDVDEIHSVQATIGQATTCAAVAGPAPERQSFEDQTNKSLLPRAGSFDQRSTSVLELLAGLTGLTSPFRSSLLPETSFNLCTLLHKCNRIDSALVQESKW